MTALFDYSTTAASNNSASPNGWPEGMAPSGVNDSDRAFAACAVGALKAVTSAGTNTITATLAPAPAAYVSGMLILFIAGGTNTGSATFNANSLGAKTIKKGAPSGNTALTGGEILSGAPYALQYDGTDMILLNPSRVDTWFDTAGNELVKSSVTASAVNEITIANAATGNKPAVSATGGDTNIGLELTPKGTGDFTVGGVSLLPSETTWTPAITADGTAGTPSYDSRPATYTKIGNRVWFECFIDLANWTGTPSGNVSITGLPFSALSLTALLIPVSVARIAGFNLSAGYTQVVAEISNAASSIRLFEAGDNVASQQIQASAVSATATIALSGSYRTA